LAATASGDFSVKVFDAITGSEVWTFPHGHIVKSVDFSPDSSKLATAGHEGILRIYDLRRPDDAPLEIPQPNKSKCSNCLWLDANTVIVSCCDGNIYFYRLRQNEGELLGSLHVQAEVRDMELQRIHATVLTVAAGDTVYFFDAHTRHLLKHHTVPIHFKEEGGASLHPSGTKFIAGGSDLWVRVFDFETGHELECHKGHHGPVRCVRYAPDGNTYASGSEDGTIRLWKTHP